MKEKTVKNLATLHNRLARVNNLLLSIDKSEFDDGELKKFKKIEDQAIKLLLDYYKVKKDIFEKRGIEIPEVL